MTDQRKPFYFAYDFIFDRLRAVRQEIVIQDFDEITTIELIEPIIMFLAYSLYRFVTWHSYSSVKWNCSQYRIVVFYVTNQYFMMLVFIYDQLLQIVRRANRSFWSKNLPSTFTRLFKKSTEMLWFSGRITWCQFGCKKGGQASRTYRVVILAFQFRKRRSIGKSRANSATVQVNRLKMWNRQKIKKKKSLSGTQRSIVRSRYHWLFGREIYTSAYWTSQSCRTY